MGSVRDRLGRVRHGPERSTLSVVAAQDLHVETQHPPLAVVCVWPSSRANPVFGRCG